MERLTEKRLIDAYKLEDLVRSNSARYHHNDDVIAAISGQPTVDAVEVVRCADCENAVPFSWTAAGEKVQGFRCIKNDGAIGYKCVVSGDDFCASGKRRIDNAND